jgi:hypothetical protein
MDVQLGYAVLRDRRVPIRPKLVVLAIGAAVVGFRELLQIPLESLFAVILPIVGIAGDIVLDGVEAVFGPILIATLLLPYLAPEPIWRRPGKGDGRTDPGFAKTILAHPDVEKARAKFDRAQKFKDQFHKDFDGADFTSEDSG